MILCLLCFLISLWPKIWDLMASSALTWSWLMGQNALQPFKAQFSKNNRWWGRWISPYYVKYTDAELDLELDCTVRKEGGEALHQNHLSGWLRWFHSTLWLVLVSKSVCVCVWEILFYSFFAKLILLCTF